MKLLTLVGLLVVNLSAATSCINQGFDSNGTAANTSETALTTASVSNLHLLYTLPLDNAMFAQPVICKAVTGTSSGTIDLIVVATMGNTISAYNPNALTRTSPIWTRNLGSPDVIYREQDASPAHGPVFAFGGTTFANQTPIGILSTPWIDATNQRIFVLYEIADESFHLRVMNLATGADDPSAVGGFLISATATCGGGSVTFNALISHQRTALIAIGTTLVVEFSGRNDTTTTWQAFVLGYSTNSPFSQTVSSCYGGAATNQRTSIWMLGRPPVDSSNRAYFLTGTGDWDGVTVFGNSILQVTSALALSGFFTPANFAALLAADVDYGSGKIILIPGSSPQAILAAGKEGCVTVLNTTITMPGLQTGSSSVGCSGNNAIQQFNAMAATPSAYSGYYGGLAFEGNTLFACPILDTCRAYSYNIGTGLFTTTPSSVTAFTNSYAPSIAVSSNNSAPGTRILWLSVPRFPEIGCQGASNCIGGPSYTPVSSSGGRLIGLDASNLATVVYDSNLNTNDFPGVVGKFVIPVPYNGRVFLATMSNQLAVYGIVLPPVVN